MRKIALIVCFALLGIPSLAQNHNSCSLAGAWYGGSPDTPFPYYQGAITPNGDDRFSIVFQYAPETQSAGYLHSTDWKGELSKKKGQTYSGVAFSIWQWDPTSPLLPPGVDPNLPELDFIHVAHSELIDCDTLRFTYDKWFVYFNFTYDIKPLEPPPPPGFIMVLDPPLVEVYHRSPTVVPKSSSQSLNFVNPGTHGRRGPSSKAVPR